MKPIATCVALDVDLVIRTEQFHSAFLFKPKVHTMQFVHHFM